MFKKLIALTLSAALVFTAAVPAFAESEAVPADTQYSAVSEDPYMPFGTIIPELTEKAPAEAETDIDAEDAETDAPAGGDISDLEDTETPGTAEGEEEAEEPAESEEDAESAEEAESSDAEEEAEKKEKSEAEKKKEEAEKAAIKYRNGLAAYMRRINKKMGKQWSRELAQTFIDIGEKYDLDPTVLMALAQRESRFYSKAKSPYGYKGMMQTSDWLAKHYGYDPQDVYDYRVSIDVAARYLRNLKKTFGTYTLALAGYMYGGTAVKNGRFSKKGAWKVMDTRDEIKEYLKKNNFV